MPLDLGFQVSSVGSQEELDIQEVLRATREELQEDEIGPGNDRQHARPHLDVDPAFEGGGHPGFPTDHEIDDFTVSAKADHPREGVVRVAAADLDLGRSFPCFPEAPGQDGTIEDQEIEVRRRAHDPVGRERERADHRRGDPLGREMGQDAIEQAQ
jgi:hypothetical protein